MKGKHAVETAVGEALAWHFHLAIFLLGFFLGRDVLSRQDCAFAKKELFHLLDDEFLVFAVGGIQAVLVQDHLAVFRPKAPGIAGDMLVNSLA